MGIIEFEWERERLQEDHLEGFKADTDSFVYPRDTIRDVAAHIHETYGDDHFLTHQSIVMSENYKTCHDRLQTLPWFRKTDYDDIFEIFKKNSDAKRFIHIRIRIFDGNMEKIEVHDVPKSELVHDPSLQEIAVLDSFSVRCSASYESDIFSNPFLDRDFSRFGLSLSHAFKKHDISKHATEHENSEISRDKDDIGDTSGDVAESIAWIWGDDERFDSRTFYSQSQVQP